jgi:hypothetical protein
MPRDRQPPTADVQQRICAFIRAGGFPRVAAEAAGVPARVFERWLRRGRTKRAPDVYRAFAAAVAEARAQARLAAELQVFDKRPLDWLKCGPGRETHTDPGWASAPKPVVGDAAAGDLSQLPEVLAVFQKLLEALAPFPEARVVAAEVITAARVSPRHRQPESAPAQENGPGA